MTEADLIDPSFTPDNPYDPAAQQGQPRASAGPVGKQQKTGSPSYAYSYGGNGMWNRTPGYQGDFYTGSMGDGNWNSYLKGGGASPEDWSKWSTDAKAKNLPGSWNQSGDTGYDWLGLAQKQTGGQNVSRGGSQGGFITGGAQYRGNLQPLVDAYNTYYGAHAKVAGDDKIDFGDGRGPQDVITRGGDLWYGGQPGSMQPGMSGSSASGSAGGTGAGAAAPGLVGAGGQAGGGINNDEVSKAIMALLGRGSTPLSADDPMLHAQFDPISRTLQSGAKRSREAAAERLSSEGLNSGGQGGALDAEVNSINENLGEQQGSAMGHFVTNELQQRRQDVVQALSLAQGEQKMSLQQQLAAIDAQLRGRALDQQNSQFYDTYAGNLSRENNTLDEILSAWLLRQ